MKIQIPTMSAFLRPIAVIALLQAGCAPQSMDFQPGSRQATSLAPRQQARHPAPLAPELKRLPNGHYRVRKPWTVVLNGRRWIVQRGYTSNGITAPARLKSAMGDGVRHPETWAAVFHDWLFTQPGISRATADRLFYDLLLAYGVSPAKARMMHTTVATYSLSKVVR